MMELKESSLYTGISSGGLSFPDCSQSTPCLFFFHSTTTFLYLFQLTRLFSFSKTEITFVISYLLPIVFTLDL